MVYAYNPSDPRAPMDFMKHSVKGQRSLMLLNSWQGSAYLPKNMKYFDVRVKKVRFFYYSLMLVKIQCLLTGGRSPVENNTKDLSLSMFSNFVG